MFIFTLNFRIKGNNLSNGFCLFILWLSQKDLRFPWSRKESEMTECACIHVHTHTHTHTHTKTGAGVSRRIKNRGLQRANLEATEAETENR